MIDAKKLVDYASSIGLELLGATRVSHVDNDVFDDWMAEGRHAEMSWLDRSKEKRKNPELVLSGVKSMIIVTLNYFQGDVPEHITKDPSRGLIARYAWYPEYHDVLKQKLEMLVAFLRTHSKVDFSCRTYVDTGPVLERYWATQAGLGFIGKNSNLIFWQYGSYVFLGEVLLDIELPEIHQHSVGGCGHCTRCMRVCPTHAIVRPGIIDARLCLSYLTIEHKGSIPVQLRKALSNRIFGCDICQEVCPWNSKAKRTPEGSVVDWDVWAPKLEEAVLYSEREFVSRYQNSPVLRTKHRGFIRNVSVALGNWGTHEARNALLRARDLHVDPLIREHVDWALDQCTTRK